MKRFCLYAIFVLLCCSLIVQAEDSFFVENFTFANDKNFEQVEFIFTADKHKWHFNQTDLCCDFSILNKWGRNAGKNEILKTIKKIQSMGFDESVALNFMFVGLESKIKEIEKEINVCAEDAKIYFNAINGSFDYKKEIVGKKMDSQNLIKSILNSLQNSNSVRCEIKTDLIQPIETVQSLKKFAYKKASFSTFCGNSSEQRISNIKTAYAAINGKKIESGEVFSFNKSTGPRTEWTGYKKAKIISKGTFLEGVGGGVCQASTTLYNAVLRSGLEILEVNQHSLPVSYVQPSMDAMVNGGSADFVFKNNTNGPIWLRTYVFNDQYVVAEVFGKKNEYDINITSRILKVLPKSKDEIVFDQSLSPKPLAKGEEIRLSNSKDGMVSEAIEEVTKNGTVVFRKKIRENRYAPTRGIVVRGCYIL